MNSPLTQILVALLAFLGLMYIVTVEANGSTLVQEYDVPYTNKYQPKEQPRLWRCESNGQLVPYEERHYPDCVNTNDEREEQEEKCSMWKPNTLYVRGGNKEEC